jgi:aminodeoxyfutalosine synthase
MLRTIAASRLLLDNIMHIKAYWVALGIDVAQLAQRFGANDLDGTVVQERVYHMSAAKSPEGLDVARLQGLIKDVGRVPVERDTAYSRFEQNSHFSLTQGSSNP